ncbi:head GIN domain-containing protein [Chloroflexota bacterium]
MKKIIIASMVLILLSLLSGCSEVKIQGSGNLVEEKYDISNFIGIKAQNGFQVEVSESDSFSVVVTTDENALEYIDIKKSGDMLLVRPKPNCSFRSVTMRAKITMPEITKVEVSGGASIDVGDFDSSAHLSVSLNGGSDFRGSINTGDIDASLSGGSHMDLSNSGDRLKADLSGGSHLTLSGSAETINIKGSGGSHFNMAEYSVKDADINLSGGSHADVEVTGTMKGSISGSSTVSYTGKPDTGALEVDRDSELNSK